MSNQDYKKTWNGFTKFVLWGTVAVIAILSNFSFYFTLIKKIYINDSWFNQRKFNIRKKSFN